MEVEGELPALIFLRRDQPVARSLVERRVPATRARDPIGGDRDDDGDREHERPLFEVELVQVDMHRPNVQLVELRVRNDEHGRQQDPYPAHPQPERERLQCEDEPQDMEQDVGVADLREHGHRDQDDEPVEGQEERARMSPDGGGQSAR